MTKNQLLNQQKILIGYKGIGNAQTKKKEKKLLKIGKKLMIMNIKELVLHFKIGIL